MGADENLLVLAPTDIIYRLVLKKFWVNMTTGVVAPEAFYRRDHPADKNGLSILIAKHCPLDEIPEIKQRLGLSNIFAVIAIKCSDVDYLRLSIAPDKGKHPKHGNIKGLPYRDTPENNLIGINLAKKLAAKSWLVWP